MNKYLLVFFVISLCLGCFADNNDYYLSTTGDNSNTCEDDGDPCLTLDGIFNKNQTTDNTYTIHISGGNYNNTGNVGVTFPSNITYTLELDSDDEDIIFDCMNLDINCFEVNGDFNVNDLTIQNCNYGVFLNGDEYDVNIKNVNFYSNEIDVYFGGDDLDISDSHFENATQSSVFVSKAGTLTIDGSYFTGALDNAIVADFTGNISDISITKSNFNLTAGIYINLDSQTNTTGELNQCTFTGVTGAEGLSGIGNSILVNIGGGNWEIDNPVFSGTTQASCTAIGYSGGNTLDKQLAVSTPDISVCDTGISFNADGKFQVHGGTINTHTNGIDVGDCQSIKLDEDIYFIGGGLSVNNQQDAIRIDISNLNFNNTKTSIFKLADTANVTITDSEFNYATAQILNIDGGDWGLDSITVTNSARVVSDGGAVYFKSNNGSLAVTSFTATGCNSTGNGGVFYIENANTAFTDCTFDSNNAASGGAIYLSQMQDFSVENCDFTSNIATGNGGAIDLESNVAGAREAHFTKGSFDSNSAFNGSAISCCNSMGSCNITVVYDKTPSFDDNHNSATGGQDVTCPTTEGTFSTAASNPDASVSTIDTSSGLGWVFWLVISLAILLVIGLIIGAIVGAFFFYKKRSSYVAVE